MLKVEFKEWLDKNCNDISSRCRKDTVCRVEKIEKEFLKLDVSFSYEKEYKKDGCSQLLDKLSHKGIKLVDTGINLPLNTIQMYPYKSALIRYVIFLKEVLK